MRSGVGMSRLEMRETPSQARASMASSSTQDQRRVISARGFVSWAPRAKALMLAGTPKIGLLATYPMRPLRLRAPAMAPAIYFAS